MIPAPKFWASKFSVNFGHQNCVVICGVKTTFEGVIALYDCFICENNAQRDLLPKTCYFFLTWRNGHFFRDQENFFFFVSIDKALAYNAVL